MLQPHNDLDKLVYHIISYHIISYHYLSAGIYIIILHVWCASV